MSKPTLYQIDLRPGEDYAAAEVERLKLSGVLVPVEPQECRLSRSEPIVVGSGELAYEITLVSDQPADSLTMHDKVWLIGDNDEPT